MKNIIVFFLLLMCIAACAQGTDTSLVSSFLVKSEYGKTVDVAALKGKVVFINFWALTCAPCLAEMPAIGRLRDHFKGDTNFVVLPIDVDSDLPHSTKYMRDKQLGLTVYTVAGVVPKTLFRGMLPCTVVFDKSGRIVYFHEGGNSYDTKEFVDMMEGLRK